MPCQKCEKTGKWKWGKRGECKYDTKKDCEDAHPDHHEENKAAIGQFYNIKDEKID